ncbi:MAG TPA: DUF4145 domain-containing protein [Myxococcaceae bacterium]|nr:DUF4145 domain-containing protein [Myxococcaceae bacterium]
MTIDRSKWTATFTLNATTGWPCPRCYDGMLVPAAHSFHKQETFESRDAKQSEDWEPDWEEERFAGLLACNRNECAESVAVCGRTHLEPSSDDPHQWIIVYAPRFFLPAPPIFRVPNGTIQSVRDELMRAWTLYWSDAASCANRIRTCVELLLTYVGVPQSTRPLGKKPARLSLHARIEKFRVRAPELAESLMAVKWLGNAGSHVGELKKDDVLDGFELLEHVLAEVFEERSKRLKRLQKDIVKWKGPRKRRR